MPQTGKQENTIQFNYFMGDQLINVKYRDGRKNFKLYKGAEKVFYNINSIVGYEDCVIVEGEMDVLALHEAGIKNVISVPNGATLNNNNLDYLDNCIDYFDDKQRVVLAVDADEPGQMLKQELVRRLGAEVCFLVDFNGEKDANDYLLEHGPELLRNAIHSARPVPLENVSTLKDVEDELRDFVKNGFKPGFKLDLKTLIKYFQLTLVSLLLLLVYLVAVSLTLLIKWLLVIIITMVGKLRMLVLKINRSTYTRTN
jgi:twinkle protein